jgi:hypothetical protein
MERLPPGGDRALWERHIERAAQQRQEAARIGATVNQLLEELAENERLVMTADE